MAAAMEERRKVQRDDEAVVSINSHHSSTFVRCGGFMVSDCSMDLRDELGNCDVAAKRCVQCGDVVDPIILRNRQLRRESIHWTPAVKLSPQVHEVESLY